jgi:hypothetical protein
LSIARATTSALRVAGFQSAATQMPSPLSRLQWTLRSAGRQPEQHEEEYDLQSVNLSTVARWSCVPVIGVGALLLGECGARTGLLVPTDAACLNAIANVCDVGQTSLSGIAFDPTGLRPLPNAEVYVPSAPLEPITSGAVCTSCAAPITGKPVAITLTDGLGRFTLNDVPAGDDIPLVVQLGKWRREISVPHVTACTANTVPTGDLRLPRNSQEGDIPLIALSTGCDQIECFLLDTIGLDSSEFTGPSGAGRVHLFRADDIAQGLPPGAGDAYALWGDLGTMMQYDILFNACECDTNVRDTEGPAYTNMESYLNAGGRLFATHYHYDWFASGGQCANSDSCVSVGAQPDAGPDAETDPSCQGPAPWNGTAAWLAPYCLTGNYDINVALPRGHTMADWFFKVTNGALPWGELVLVDTRNDVGATTDSATPWILINNGALAGSDTYYLSFNTPVGTPVTSQCGRAVFSDVHLVGTPGVPARDWPASCTPIDAGLELGGDHTTNELALEYLFFDLESCVQDDTKPITIPCAN